MLTQSKPTHLKARPLKMNGTPLLKWLVAFCMLDGVAASEFDAISNPDLNPSPAPEPTCGCAAEIHLMRTQLRKEFEAKLEAKLVGIRQFVGMTPPSSPPAPPTPPPSPPPPPP
eukprot:scaffold3818_cov58-Phaeocystis_antarctica.AAC.1